MDGNGRWATRRTLPRLEGHRRGAKAVRRVVEFSRRNGIKILTLYAFSTENWRRPKSEVSGLMSLLSQYLDSELEEIHKNDIRFVTIGDVDKLPEKLLSKINQAKAKTAGNSSMILNIALSYGGRRDIMDAALKIADKIKGSALEPEDVDEELFCAHLHTAGLPDPDLLIRTGGELRISNFLLWQCAYTELYFTDTLWPDFDDDVFMAAIESFSARQRRYGMAPDQV
jgi:undecaprenyl diphosphate synthase